MDISNLDKVQEDIQELKDIKDFFTMYNDTVFGGVHSITLGIELENNISTVHYLKLNNRLFTVIMRAFDKRMEMLENTLRNL
jgi:hypothetical protein